MNNLRPIFLAIAIPLFTCAQEPAVDSPVTASDRGRAFLASLLDKDINLLPEFRGHNVYWLYHDNYLVTKVLAESHPQIAAAIQAAIRKHGEDQSGKIEILFGESKRPLPFRHYDLVEVQRNDVRIIRTERVTDRVMVGWEAYADLRFLAAIAQANGEADDQAAAEENFKAGLRMWHVERKGFADAVIKTRNIYATYKLALAILAADRLDQIDQLPPGLIDQLKRMQDETGGWITDYQPDGMPVGKANVETTCLAILALDCLK